MTREEMVDIICDITEIIQDFCDNEMLSVDVGNGDSFGYYDGTTVVKFHLLKDFQDDLFMANAYAKGLEFICSSFVMSLLHEIGHYYTQEWLTKEEDRKCKRIKNKFNGNVFADNFKYFDVYDEKLATDWAIEYANSNKDKVLTLGNEISSLIEQLDVDMLKNYYAEFEEDDVNEMDILDFIEFNS